MEKAAPAGLVYFMDPIGIIDRHYGPYPEARRFLLAHAGAVATKALEIAAGVGHLNPDAGFIREAALLHDIGMFMTDAPVFGCHGEKPYICHGVLGRQLLEREGMDRHALVCERHVGVGLTAGDIRENGFPMPERDMTPQSLEEKIVCFADKFFSKNGDPLAQKPLSVVRVQIKRYGPGKLEVFEDWLHLFGG
jgi:uncharacterized protein